MEIVLITGSLREGATSTRLAQYIERLIQAEGHKTHLFDLYRQPLPFYSPEETNNHEHVKWLKERLRGASGIVLATPEYHGAMSGVLKNALDHLGQEEFGGKAVLSISSSGGPVGVSSLQQLQAVVRNLHGVNCPEWISIGGGQRKVFERPIQDPYEIDTGMNDRVHLVLGTFLRLARILREA